MTAQELALVDLVDLLDWLAANGMTLQRLTVRWPAREDGDQVAPALVAEVVNFYQLLS